MGEMQMEEGNDEQLMQEQYMQYQMQMQQQQMDDGEMENMYGMEGDEEEQEMDGEMM